MGKLWQQQPGELVHTELVLAQSGCDKELHQLDIADRIHSSVGYVEAFAAYVPAGLHFVAVRCIANIPHSVTHVELQPV